ncbi:MULTISPECIES: copper-binding protein [unclassified Novosphingobium]|jgi:Cu/Ag efflux protein CusF|uniref:copper-binding protein n=1 Tax=unclassified Novosphingobium TaxID=2644732 RepID=UPI00086D644B|nr:MULTISPECIES: copper-binding protein [unclassified Novosphingobium]MBN9142536.1 copper-binding protein [Novosphingobium sp.]ODU76861.1 MAG: hypothetical protein ABT10_25860 [Novosphingobium sp. SCN 63-17]OJX94576.1 MAG: hypothetical protein BGP00_16555 [Novosphingobium sp. 63-713]
MKSGLIITSSLALLASLAACNKQPESSSATTAPAGSKSTPKSTVDAVAIVHGASTGTITAVDLAKGTITLDHKEIPALQWAAMKMGFSANPEVLQGFKVGDHVSFEVDWDGRQGTVTKLRQGSADCC